MANYVIWGDQRAGSAGATRKQPVVSVYRRVDSKPMSVLARNYTVISRLGRGGFAHVYLVRGRESGQFYAGKHQVSSVQ